MIDNLIEHTENPIRIYVDGSAHSTNHTMGAGIIAPSPTKESSPHTISLVVENKKLQNHGQRVLYAEHAAVKSALEHIAEGTKVTIHGDNTDAMYFLDSLVPKKNRSIAAFSTRRVFKRKSLNAEFLNDIEQEISKQVKRIGKKSIVVRISSSKENLNPVSKYYMQLAHNAACNASGTRAHVSAQPPNYLLERD